MDFWAQHKDFVLRVAAGFGIFLVALIARGITYGDELEAGERINKRAVGDLKKMKIVKSSDVADLEENAKKLIRNADALRGQIGFDISDPEALKAELIKRTLGYLRTYRETRDATKRDNDAQNYSQAIAANVNGGFGQLRLTARDELVEEASERNIRVEGVGFDAVTTLEDEELLKYLLQLELVARLARYCIDAGVTAIEEIRIETKDHETIPGANPAFLYEYTVRFGFRGSVKATAEVLNKLNDAPAVPMRGLSLERTSRPADHLIVEMQLLAVAADTSVPFIVLEDDKEKGQ